VVVAAELQQQLEVRDLAVQEQVEVTQLNSQVTAQF
jgi:hypothetical protein